MGEGSRDQLQPADSWPETRKGTAQDTSNEGRNAFTARVAPAWDSDAMSGAETLSSREMIGSMGEYRMPMGGRQLDTEVGYGLLIGAQSVGTPRVGLRTSESGRNYRLDDSIEVLEQGNVNLQLGVGAERRVSPVSGLRPGGGAADQRVLSGASLSC